MTEAEWWGATGHREWPDPFFHWLFFFGGASDRKMRLSSIACCQSVEDMASDARFPSLLRLIEAFADRQESESRLRNAVDSAGEWHSIRDRLYSPSEQIELAAQAAILAAGAQFRDREWHQSRKNYPYACYVVDETAHVFELLGKRDVAERLIVRIVHDIFGPLPFRDIAADPSWLTSTVVALARGIYDGKAFDRLPVLADALEDAGCANDDILSHCRAADWEHVRGCWVVDLLLGRPWREQ